MFGPQQISCEDRRTGSDPPPLHSVNTASSTWRMIDDPLPALQLAHSRPDRREPSTRCKVARAKCLVPLEKHSRWARASALQHAFISVHLSSLGFLLGGEGRFELCWLLYTLRIKPQNPHKLFPLPSVLTPVQLRQEEESEKKRIQQEEHPGFERSNTIYKAHNYTTHIITFLSQFFFFSIK